MNLFRIELPIAAVVLFGVEEPAARAAATCLSIAGSTSLVQVGTTLTFTGNCCAAVPALANHRWLLGGLLLIVGALVVRRHRPIVSGLLLWALLNSFALPAQGQSCGPPFQWKAQSASETFVGSGTSFSFTPTHAGLFTVSLSDASEAVSPVSIQVVDQPPQIASLAPPSASTTPGGTISFVVSLDVPAPVGGSTVSLALSPPTAGTVPATVVVPANQLSAAFNYVDGGQGTAATVIAVLGASQATANIASSNLCQLAHLVISEIRSRGIGGASDEFLELSNPTSDPVMLDSTWKLEGRSNTATSFSGRWTGTGKVIPAHGHFLVAGTAYTQVPTADEALSSGIADASAVRLTQAGGVVDIVCYGFDASSTAAFVSDSTYGCQGTPVANNPHNNAASTNTDASLERKPGGAAGNCTDTGDNGADFQLSTPANPQDSASPPTP
jgi:hypothetical protein